MKKNITMSDIAKELNVSTVTVSKALSDKDGVSDALRETIKKQAKLMHYRYNSAAKGMKEGLTYNIGVVVADRYLKDNQSFYWNIYEKLIKHLAKHQYYAVLEVLDRNSEKSCDLPGMIVSGRVDGLIILGQLKVNYIDLLLEQKFPVIFLDFYDRHFQMDAVVGDNMYGAYTITNYLISKGHKKIGYVGNIHATSSILDRYLGYYKSLIENEVEIREEWAISDRDADGRFCNFRLEGELPTAFVCNCDEVAYHFIKYLRENGIRVPEDISVVGFDNSIFASISQPAITTISVDIEAMAEIAVDGIIGKISDESSRLGRKVVDGKLVVGESVKEL